MDSDMEVNSKTFSALISALNNKPSIGLVAPKLVYGSGALQKSTDVFPTITHKIYRYFFLKKIENEENLKKQADLPQHIDYAISAFWLFKKELLESIGLLDEKFFYAPEDVDFCLRIWQQGYKILYVPQTYAIHYAQEISRGLKFNKAMREHIKGLIYLFFKHRYLFRRPKFNP